jgi:hypothetical protein
MLNYFEYLLESKNYFTLEIKATYKQISDVIDNHSLKAEIISKIHTCYVITDLHSLQIFRHKLDILNEWSDIVNLNKMSYEFKILTYNSIETKILDNFFKKFQHHGIYNLKYQDNILNLESYDTREAVLEYLKIILNRVIKNKISII